MQIWILITATGWLLFYVSRADRDDHADVHHGQAGADFW